MYSLYKCIIINQEFFNILDNLFELSENLLKQTRSNKNWFLRDHPKAVLREHLMAQLLATVKTIVAGRPVDCSTHQSTACRAWRGMLYGLGTQSKGFGLLKVSDQIIKLCVQRAIINELLKNSQI